MNDSAENQSKGSESNSLKPAIQNSGSDAGDKSPSVIINLKNPMQIIGERES